MKNTTILTGSLLVTTLVLAEDCGACTNQPLDKRDVLTEIMTIEFQTISEVN